MDIHNIYPEFGVYSLLFVSLILSVEYNTVTVYMCCYVYYYTACLTFITISALPVEELFLLCHYFLSIF